MTARLATDSHSIVQRIHALARNVCADEIAHAKALPVNDWPKVPDADVLLLVVHENALYEKDAETRQREWTGWHRGQWITFNRGGFTWYGMAGIVTHIAPYLPTDSDSGESA